MSTPIFAKLSAELHRHPKARRAGYHGTNVFRVVLELNALHGATGRLSPAHSEPYFLADALMCTEEEAARGVEAAIRARLLDVAQDGSLGIVGWDDDEWGRGARLKAPDSGAVRNARYKQRLKSSPVTRGDVTGDDQRHRCDEVTRGDDRVRDQSQRSESDLEEKPEREPSPSPSARGSSLTPAAPALAALALVPSEPKRKRKAPEVPLPPDWQPNARHRELAREFGKDLEFEAERMRNRALAKAEVFANWDARFNNWLMDKYGGGPRAGPARGNGTGPLTGLDALMAQVAEEKSR